MRADPEIVNQAELIRESSVQAVESFPQDIQDMIKNTDPSALHLAQLKYRPPWDMMRRNFNKDTVVLAGDAMHAMGPFLAQGDSASVEDEVVLARCLSEVVEEGGKFSPGLVEGAMRRYVKERKTRVMNFRCSSVSFLVASTTYESKKMKLSTETYLVGKLIETTSGLTKLVVILLLAIFFRGNATHAKFRCGEL
ncbi:unnamed protein product [Rhodiola kirilowii]